MSLWKFLGWFIVGLVGTWFLINAIKNSFIVGLIIGLIIGVLGAKD